MKVSARVRVSGPLSSMAAGFASELATQGYTDLSLAVQLRFVAHFSRWLDERGIELSQLTPDLVDEYVALRRRTHTAPTSRHGMMPLLNHLGLTRAVSHPVPAPSDLVVRYRAHLVDERALSAPVRARYEAVAEEFLDGRAAATLRRADVLAYASRLAGGPDLAGRLSGLRSILRFLHVTGEITSDLAATVPAMARWRQASLPQALEAEQVRAVLSSCDRRTVIGRRNYAVLLLMVRLGLRACEVASLTLDDIDWSGGELIVRGKGSVGRLPLPADIGEALVAWLHRRRRAPTRSLFLTSHAPIRAVSVGRIIGIAAEALRKAGVANGGGHRLRHTAATTMLRRGASLTEIAQVLRHRDINTTAIYAKVDRDALRALAQPWPATTAPELHSLMQSFPGGSR
jgi:integrase/recombinase XerD